MANDTDVAATTGVLQRALAGPADPTRRRLLEAMMATAGAATLGLPASRAFAAGCSVG